MPDANGDNCEHCGNKKEHASNDPLSPAGTERLCLDSECYEKRMADLAKTDIDQALEVCGAWERANAYRRAHESSHAGPSRPSMRDYEDYTPVPMMESWRPAYGHPEGFDPSEELLVRTNWDDGTTIRKNDSFFIDEYGQMFGFKCRRGYQIMADWFRKRNR